jgi:hypothetical protein
MPALRKPGNPNRAGEQATRLDVVPDSKSLYWTKGE